MPAAEFRDDILGKSIREEFLIGIPAHIGERQDGDAGLHHRRPETGLRRHPFAGTPRQDAVHPNRSADVLEGPLAQILERRFQSTLDLSVDSASDADTPDFGQLFDAGGDVHTVAIDVAVLEYDVAEIDADPELDASIARHIQIAPSHTFLDLDRGMHGICNAMELDQHAVAARLDYAAMIPVDHRIDELDAMRSEPGKRAALVCFHEPAVADHVCCHYRR